jgi:hypothetical protein
LVGLEFQPVPCTITQGTTVLVWGISNTCSSVEDPPYFAVSAQAAQRTCAAGLAPFVTSDRFTLDGGQPVDLQQRRFDIFSSQLGVQLPADNPFGAPPGAGTFTAWGQIAWLQHLPPGHHTIQDRDRVQRRQRATRAFACHQRPLAGSLRLVCRSPKPLDAGALLLARG